jgi:hypothetical protein
MTAFTESVVEDAALAWLETLGCAVLCSYRQCGQRTRRNG